MIGTRGMVITAPSAFTVAAELTGVAVKSVPAMVGAVGYFGMLLQTAVKAAASGRPGPNVVTGDYRRSISLTVSMEGISAVAHVGTDRPQGRRLEFGFHGADSLGRVYNQPPYAHFGPAVQIVGPLFQTGVAGIARGLLS